MTDYGNQIYFKIYLSEINETTVISKAANYEKQQETSNIVENIQARMKIRSKNLQKSVENTWENSNLYFDTSDGEYWDQENVYLSEHHYEEVLDVETAKSLLNFGDDYKQFLESNNSEVQSPRNSETTKKRRSSSKVR